MKLSKNNRTLHYKYIIMTNNFSAHTFHIPVMGIGYTIDTPVKVAPYGISSVISLLDDILIEKMRAHYCKLHNIEYQEITNKDDDFRALRIKEYLNLLNDIINEDFEALKKSIYTDSKRIDKYFNLLPDSSTLKQEYAVKKSNSGVDELYQWLDANLPKGSIDVNIMTKLDKENYRNGDKLPVEFNDAHAALRGFAESNIEASLVLSAGMNPRLFAYFEKFTNFYPRLDGTFAKKVILKVSDYRSALVQGKMLAKRGVWVSEYRIESGLNCGGHAFASEGNLLGPILEEFKKNREELINEVYPILKSYLDAKGVSYPAEAPAMKITAQGGVGTNEEHEFLLNYYQLDSVGWGSPFLLVPEITNIDEETLELVRQAKEEDLYLSNISPLGVPFNNLRGNTKDAEQRKNAELGHPGAPCVKKYGHLNSEFTDLPICTGSNRYQQLKIKELKEQNLSPEQFEIEYNKVIEKSCICVGLGTTPLLVNDLDTSVEGQGVSICPGPNIAYFDKISTLEEMVDHIYGRINLLTTNIKRPNFFVKELMLYVDYISNKFSETTDPLSDKQNKYFKTFQDNLLTGIEYYKNLFSEESAYFTKIAAEVLSELNIIEEQVQEIYVRA